MLRKIFFWLHLAAGSLAGIVILIMSITGVLLAWQRQIIHYADRQFRQPSAVSQAARATPETLLAKVVEARRALPTTLTLRADPTEPASAEFGRNAVVYLHPATGQVLGEGSTAVRAFFRSTEDWHRWLAVGLESRASARGITGACNLLFLGLLLSGFYLWLPRIWSRQYLRSTTWFRRGLNGKARDFNWHNVIGIWCVAPLFVIVASAVVMSYPWANNLVYRITGSELPQPNGAGPGGGGRGPARRRRTRRSRTRRHAESRGGLLRRHRSRLEARRDPGPRLEDASPSACLRTPGRPWSSPSIRATAAVPTSAPNSPSNAAAQIS